MHGAPGCPHAGRMGRTAEIAAATVLVLAALGSVLAGAAMTWLSSGVFGTGQTDARPALAGLLVGGCLATAAVGLRAGWEPWVVLALAAALPTACLVAAPHSTDLGNLALVVMPAWGGLAWLVLRQ